MNIVSEVLNHEKRNYFSLRDVSEKLERQNDFKIRRKPHSKNKTTHERTSVGRVRNSMRAGDGKRHRLRILNSGMGEDDSVSIKKIYETYENTVHDVVCNSENEFQVPGDNHAYISDSFN